MADTINMKTVLSHADVSRRQFIKTSSLLAAGTAVAPYAITSHAAPDDPIRVALIGCGSRGMGAVQNVLTAGPNIKLVALGDLFPDRMIAARAQLEKMGSGPSQGNTWAPGSVTKSLQGMNLKIADEFCFTGFDAYRKVLAIPEVNYVILATPPHFRSIHLKTVIEAGKHAFVEKPVAVDPTGVRSVLASGELAKQKGLGILAGTQRRHQANYVETMKRIHDGALGTLTSARAYWNQGTMWMKDRKPEWSDLEWQLRNWMYFTWLSGDHIVEQHLHNIDVINWAMKEHPISALGLGGRQVRTGPEYGNIYDHFAVEFEYKSGLRLQSFSRQMDNCSNAIGEVVVGTKGSSTVNVGVIKGENAWRYAGKAGNPYDDEHVDFVNSIRAGQPLNEAQAIAESNLTAIMGREATYSGQLVDWDSAMESKLDLSPKAYAFGPMAVPPVAMPGQYKFIVD